MLASATLNETLEQIVTLVFEAAADRCLIMMRDEGSEDLRVAVARLRDRVGEVGEIRVSRNVLDEVVIRGKSVLTSDAQHDPGSPAARWCCRVCARCLRAAGRF